MRPPVSNTRTLPSVEPGRIDLVGLTSVKVRVREREVVTGLGWRILIKGNKMRSVTIDPEVMMGKPCLSGTRITVELILEMLSYDCPREEIIKNYPSLTNFDINQCLRYAMDTVHDEWVEDWHKRKEE